MQCESVCSNFKLVFLQASISSWLGVLSTVNKPLTLKSCFNIDLLHVTALLTSSAISVY